MDSSVPSQRGVVVDSALSHDPFPSVAVDEMAAGVDQSLHLGRFVSFYSDRPQREPVGAHVVPFLNHHAVGFEELADAEAVPAGNVFENRRQDCQGAGAERRASCDHRDVAGV